MAEKNCKLCFHYDVCYAVGRMTERAETCTKYAPDVAEVVRCKDCKYFFAYTEDDIADGNKVERTDGVCYMRVANSNDKQFCAATNDDFCSYGTPKERGGEK